MVISVQDIARSEGIKERNTPQELTHILIGLSQFAAHQLILKTYVFVNNSFARDSLCHQIRNTIENFWNVYCFATNQMRDETAKDNGQTIAGISHDLVWNNELALSSMRNLQFSFCLWNSYCLPQINISHLIPSVQKPNYRIDLKVSANCENLQQYRFTSWVKVSQLQVQSSKDRKPPITAN